MSAATDTTTCPADILLLQCTGGETAGLATAAAACAAQAPWPLQVQRAAWSAQAGSAYVYLRPPQRLALDAAALAPLAQAWQAACAGMGATQAQVSRLEMVFDSPGASAGTPAPFHYVVEMDPDTGWMPELARWYDTEHMPGLAAVAGCTRAQRFLNHDHGPYSLACYDLVTTDTLGCPPWLAVRHSAWSDVVRPHFTNTKRTMFDVAQ